MVPFAALVLVVLSFGFLTPTPTPLPDGSMPEGAGGFGLWALLELVLTLAVLVPLFSAWLRWLCTPTPAEDEPALPAPKVRAGQPELMGLVMLLGIGATIGIVAWALGKGATSLTFYKEQAGALVGLGFGLLAGPLVARLFLLPAYAVLERPLRPFVGKPWRLGAGQGFSLLITLAMGGLTTAVAGVLLVVMLTGVTATLSGSITSGAHIPQVVQSIVYCAVITYATGFLAGVLAFGVRWMDGWNIAPKLRIDPGVEISKDLDDDFPDEGGPKKP